MSDDYGNADTMRWRPAEGIVTDEDEPARIQVTRLGQWILDNIPGEPSQSQGAVDTAIRLLVRAVGKEAPAIQCEPCEDTGTVECWSPGGPCPEDRTVCDLCGPCRSCNRAALVAAAEQRGAESERERIKDAVLAMVAVLYTVKSALDEPYPDMPDWTRWTRFVDPAVEALCSAAGLL